MRKMARNRIMTASFDHPRQNMLDLSLSLLVPGANKFPIFWPNPVCGGFVLVHN